MSRTYEQFIRTLHDREADKALSMTRGGNRYGYDENLGDGWEQYDTREDAWYFGVWVNVAERKVFTYAEGDRILEVAENQEAFTDLLQHMDTFYGKAPPMAIGLSRNSRTEFFAARPGDSLISQAA